MLGTETEQADVSGCPKALAEQLLATARQGADRRGQVSALTDLALILLHEGNAQRAITLLEQALTLGRLVGDRIVECDILCNLALATIIAGQPAAALRLLEQALTSARKRKDSFAEKAALECSGLAYVKLRDPGQALTFFEQALGLARMVGHRRHEAELLWQLGIQHADIGQRDRAAARAQESVDLLHELGNPEATWYAHHLQQYRADEGGVLLAAWSESGPITMPRDFSDGWFAAILREPDPGPRPAPAQPTTGPGVLRMAITATKSMTQFLGSGLKTAPPQMLRQRLRTCAACEHHTGLRCRLCGCFTNVKARMAHEQCPIEKWS
jgi:tetratricopeptide (TPR) repeat protein